MQRLHDTFATWNRIVLAASRGRVFLLLDCTAPWRFLGSRDLLVVLLRDRVADNLTFRDLTESETLLIGRNFGVVTDIEPGPRGTLFVMSLDQGAIYEISRAGGRGGDDEDRSEQIRNPHADVVTQDERRTNRHRLHDMLAG